MKDGRCHTAFANSNAYQELNMNWRHLTYLVAVCLFGKAVVFFSFLFLPPELLGGIAGISPADMGLLHDGMSGAFNISVFGDEGRSVLWYQFDSLQHMRIATNGYDTRYAGNFVNVVLPDRFLRGNCLFSFAPVYPLLIRLASIILEGHIAALVVSNMFSFLAVVLFYLVAVRYVGTDCAFRATALFALFPYNLVSGSLPYTEPVFVCFAMLSWMSLSGKNPVLAGFFASLASLTRYPGIVLLPILTFVVLFGSLRKSSKREVVDIVIINAFALPFLFWAYHLVPSMSGFSLFDINSICWGLSIFPLGAVLTMDGLGVIFCFFALVGVYYLKDLDAGLFIYSLLFMAFHLCVLGAGEGFGRYIGVIWPTFIYFGRRFDRTDTVFFSALFVVVAVFLVELQAKTLLFI
jgi:hypothetical protein